MRYFIEYKTKLGIVQLMGDYFKVLYIIKEGYVITKLIPMEVRND